MTELSSTCEAIMQTPSEERLVALLDQWSLQWTWRGRQRAIGAGAYERYCTLGLYAFGGNAPNVSKASSMKEACIAVNRFMRHRFPHGTWTSIAVLLNPRIGLHRDMQNMVGKLNHALLELSMEVESGLKTKKELPSKQPPKTAKFVSSKEHGWTFMTNLCLSTRDGFIKLSHMKVICGRSRHTRRNRLNAAPMKFVQSWRNLRLRKIRWNGAKPPYQSAALRF